jgi:hypothetical protein
VALRERFLHVLLTLTGQKVTVTLRSGAQYTGILHTATPFSHLPEAQRHKYVLKAVTVEQGSGDSAVKPGSTVLLDMKQVAQLHVKSCRLDALVSQKSSDAFTDTEISNATVASNATKDLERAHAAWTEAGDSVAPTVRGKPFNSRAAALAGSQTTTTTTTATSSGALKGSIAGWDQFKANEEMFNVKATFDETMYTTPLDHSQISESEKLKAEKLAREIESTVSTNIHLAEERGQITNQDYDEEDRYSGVLKADLVATDAKPLSSAETATKVKTTIPAPKLNYAKAAAATKAPAPLSIPDKKEKPEAPPSSKEQPIVSEPPKPKNEVTENKVPEPKEEIAENKLEEVPKEDDRPKAEETAAAAAASEKEEEKPKSKLNANAKEFSLNVNARSFTPGVPTSQGPPPPPPPPPPPLPHQYIDPNTGMPIPMMPHHGMQPGTFVIIVGRCID